MKPSMRLVASATLAAVLTCALLPALAYAGTKASPSNSTRTSTDTNAPASTTDSDDEKPKAKTPVTIVSATLPYRVKTGSKWGDVVEAGKTAGDKGEPATGIQLKRIKIVKSNGKKRNSKNYELQVYTSGAWNKVAATHGFTTSDGLIQAIKLKLKKSIAEDYDVYYRAYCRNFGWLGWTKNGEAAGTTRQGISLRAIQVKLVKKTKKNKPSSGTLPSFVKKPSLRYAAGKVSDASTIKKTRKNGATAGKATYSTKLDKIKLSLSDNGLSGTVKYRVRTGSNNSSGWTGWKKSGAKCGTKRKAIQAVKIKLTGQMAKFYDIYYRVYSGDHHWLGWACNGQKTGTGGVGYPIGALQAVLVPKGDGAPGSTDGKYLTHSVGLYGAQLDVLRKAQKYYSNTGYLILVNRSACRTVVFEGSHNDWQLKHYWSCCVGKPSTPTVSGQFSIGYKQYSFGEQKGYSCYYATQIYEDYLFHSILYYANTRNIMDATMGAQVSHGCIRLHIDNAKWIYNNIGSGTKVVIY